MSPISISIATNANGMEGVAHRFEYIVYAGTSFYVTLDVPPRTNLPGEILPPNQVIGRGFMRTAWLYASENVAGPGAIALQLG